MNNVKEITYPCLMQSILNKHVVRFDNPSSGEVVKEVEATCISKGFYSDKWIPCTNKSIWQPYVEGTPEWPKIMEGIYEGQPDNILIVEFDSEYTGKVLESINTWYTVGEWSEGWCSCFNEEEWKPYVKEENIMPEYPKMMRNLHSNLVVSFISEFTGEVVSGGDWIGENGLDKFISCFDVAMWQPYTGTEFKLPVEPSQTPSAELLASSEPMTAQELVKSLEEMKHSLNDLEAVIDTKKTEYSSKWAEYQDLKEQLLTLI